MNVTLKKDTIWSMMGAINHWWAGDRATHDAPLKKTDLPFWVSHLIATITELTGETFDLETGEWSGD